MVRNVGPILFSAFSTFADVVVVVAVKYLQTCIRGDKRLPCTCVCMCMSKGHVHRLVTSSSTSDGSHEMQCYELHPKFLPAQSCSTLGTTFNLQFGVTCG